MLKMSGKSHSKSITTEQDVEHVLNIDSDDELDLDCDYSDNDIKQSESYD
uniref:Uncharacterized protein n=1 Tax=Arion vulgaris TaxID=1028688 RepID=A0A0B7AQI3_9EUPU